MGYLIAFLGGMFFMFLADTFFQMVDNWLKRDQENEDDPGPKPT